MKRFSLFVCLFLLLLLVTAGLPPASATPEVYSIYPSSAPVNTDVTVTITGSGFSAASTPYLYKCALVSGSPGSQRKFAGTIRSVTPTMMVVKFSLSYDPPLKLGSYGVIVNTPMETSPVDMGYKENIFTIYSASDTAYPTATTTVTETTTETHSSGDNSVFFDTNPSGATVILDGDEVGTSAFTYYTSKDGTHDVVIKKLGFEDYRSTVTIVEDKRVYFYALLTPLSSTTTAATATASMVKTVTTTRDTTTTTQKSTLKVPTPWGTDPPVTEESPADPAVALGAAGIAIGLVLLRRR